jgi:hypothetical protein
MSRYRLIGHSGADIRAAAIPITSDEATDEATSTGEAIPSISIQARQFFKSSSGRPTTRSQELAVSRDVVPSMRAATARSISNGNSGSFPISGVENLAHVKHASGRISADIVCSVSSNDACA